MHKKDQTTSLAAAYFKYRPITRCHVDLSRQLEGSLRVVAAYAIWGVGADGNVSRARVGQTAIDIYFTVCPCPPWKTAAGIAPWVVMASAMDSTWVWGGTAFVDISTVG